MKKQKLIVIVGPTGSGKTSLGIKLAQEFSGEIISVDSRQIYHGLDIGSGKVIGEQKNNYLLVDGILHYGLDLVDPDEEYNVADFQKYAQEKIKEISARGKSPFLVGGTGLWVKAVVDNLRIPEVAPNKELRNRLEKLDINSLYTEYKALDPEGAEIIDKNNKRRLVRAVEVCMETGKPFYDNQSQSEDLYDALFIGIDVERDELVGRMNARVDEMVEQGLFDEVSRLNNKYGRNTVAMGGIGYQQVCEFLNGEVAKATAIENIKIATRQYARRQMTWFKKEGRIKWVKSDKTARTLVENFLK